MTPREPRVLIYDIETAPIRGVAWRKRDTDLVWIDRDWHLLSFAYKWLGKKTIHDFALPDFPSYRRNPTDDRALACELWKLQDRADIVVAHNGRRFDQKKARAKYFEHGFEPPSPFREVDTLQIAKQHFAFTSNRLDDLCRLVGIEGKIDTGGAGLWRAVLDGDPKAWRLMRRYGKQDVRILEPLYLRLRPWADGHPNMALIADRPDVCSKCGKPGPFQSAGWRYYTVTKRRAFRCRSCGGKVYGRSIEKSSVLHVN